MKTFTPLANKPCGAELNAPVNQGIQETNSMLSGMNVNNLFKGSRINNETGQHGLAPFIAEILTKRHAFFQKYDKDNPKHVENRHIWVSYAMSKEEIIAAVRNENGGDIYTDHSIATFLSTHMQRKGHVASIRLESCEAPARDFKTTPVKYYLVAE